MKAKNKKPIFIVCMILFVMLTVIIVGVLAIVKLATGIVDGMIIDEKKMLQQADSYSYRVCNTQTRDNTMEMSFRKFTGIDTLWYLDVKEGDALEITYEVVIEDGEFEMIIVTSEDEIMTLAQGSNVGEEIIVLPEGRNRIRIIGDGAKGNIVCELDASDNIKIKSAGK